MQEHRQPLLRKAPVPLVHGEAGAGQADRRRERPYQGKTTVMFRQVGQRRRLSWDAGGQGAVQGQLRYEAAGRVQIYVAPGRQRCPLAAVEHQLAPILGPVEEPEAAAAQSRAIGLHYRQRGADRHRRIEGVAPSCQDLESRLSGQGVSAGDRRLGRAVRCPKYPGGEQQQGVEGGKETLPERS